MSRVFRWLPLLSVLASWAVLFAVFLLFNTATFVATAAVLLYLTYGGIVWVVRDRFREAVRG